MKFPLVSLKDALAAADIFVDGDWVESKDQDPNGDVRLIQLADIGVGKFLNKSSRFLSSAKARELRCTFLEEGDVLVARMPDPIGRACIFPGDTKRSVTVVDVCVIRPKADSIDSRWLMHYLNSPGAYTQVVQMASGTTRSRISRGNLGKIQMPLPSIGEQRRIAEALDQVDAIRAKRREAISLLESLSQSIFLDLFGDTSAIGERWPIHSIKDVCDLIVDCVNRTAPFVEHETPYKMIRTTNIKGGNVNLSEVRYVDRETFIKWNRRATPAPGDVILTREAPVGEAGILKTTDHVFLGQRLMLYRPDLSRLKSEYLLAVFQSRFLQQQFNKHGSGTTVKHLSLPVCRELQVPVPPLGMQERFEVTVSRLRALKKMHQMHMAELDTLFASLQHRAFRGELWSDETVPAR